MTQQMRERVIARAEREDVFVAEAAHVRYLHLNLLAGSGVTEFFPAITLSEIAKITGVPPQRVSEIVKESVDHLTALRLRRDTVLAEGEEVKAELLDSLARARARRFHIG